MPIRWYYEPTTDYRDNVNGIGFPKGRDWTFPPSPAPLFENGRVLAQPPLVFYVATGPKIPFQRLSNEIDN